MENSTLSKHWWLIFANVPPLAWGAGSTHLTWKWKPNKNRVSFCLGPQVLDLDLTPELHSVASILIHPATNILFRTPDVVRNVATVPADKDHELWL